ncbi:MAG: glycosyltransferase family 2 protein [Rubricoccaceae bacterium]
MSKTPRVSIGLPVYNGERYLATTLEDLLGQSFSDFELVVCDNASTDATPDLLEEAARQDSRVRIVRNRENIGALPNANKAFDGSRGELYVLSAYDDRHAPGFLAMLVEALDASPEAGLAYGRCTLIDEDDQPLAFDCARRAYVDARGLAFDYDAQLERTLPRDRVGRYRAVLRSNDVNAPIHGLFRRRLLERVGPHRLHGSDRLIVAHAALLQSVAFVDAPLFGYRIHAESTYHLTRDEWLSREAGRNDASSPLDGARTLKAYLGAVASSPLSVRERISAVYETFRYAVRPEVLQRLFQPGPDHYFGWTGSANENDPEREAGGGYSAAVLREKDWEWLRARSCQSTG